jgi:hypothetical protein
VLTQIRLIVHVVMTVCPQGNDVVRLVALASRIRQVSAGEFNKLIADIQIVSQSSKTNAFGGVVCALMVNTHDGALTR